MYRYQGVPASAYEWLMRNPNKGGLFNRMIRDRYPYRDMTTPPATLDLTEALTRSLETSRE